MVGSINFVNVGGHLFTIMGDGRGQFQWTSNAENLCLDRHLRVGTRITPHRRTLDNGRMFAFAFERDYDSMISAFMLYLCARGKNITNQQLRNLLANHIEEHLDGFHNTYDPHWMQLGTHRTHRQAIDWFCTTRPAIANRANFRIPGERLPHTFIQAFCDVFGYVCEVYLRNYNPKTEREVGTIQIQRTYRPNKLPGYPYDARDLESPVRFLNVDSSQSNIAYQLLGTVESSFDVDAPMQAPVIDLR